MGFVTDNKVNSTTVVKVLWTQNENKNLIPKIITKIITPNLITRDSEETPSDAYIYSITGHCARFIFDNKIGPKAVVEIKYINAKPFISRVITPADKPQMPLIPYIWNSNINISPV